MKKIKLFALMLIGVFSLAGCRVSDEDGKAWAEENGYVKQESVTGTYELSYVIVRKNGEEEPTEIFTTCPIYDDKGNQVYTEYKELDEYCYENRGKHKLYLTETETAIEFGISSSHIKQILFPDEYGYFYLVSYYDGEPETSNAFKYMIRDNKVYASLCHEYLVVNENGSNWNYTYTYTLVYSKKK